MQLLQECLRIRQGRTLPVGTRGNSLIEFALLLPVFVLLMSAVIEFGWYFVRYEALTRALSITSLSIINSSTTTQAFANGTGSGVIPLGTSPNYICAQAYQTNADASAANPYCASGTWAPGGATITCSDTGKTCTTPYYVGVVAHATSVSLTGMVSAVLPKGTAITQSVVVQVGGSSFTIPTCTGGQVLTSLDGKTLTCTLGQTGGAFMGEASFTNAEAAGATYNGNYCEYSNPVTGGCSCPPGYTAYPIWSYDIQSSNGEYGKTMDGLAATWICLF